VLTRRNRDELEAAYRTHGDDLWRAIYAFSEGSREIADDAVAEAFIRAGHRWDEIGNPKAWLYSVAFRLAAAELRSGRRRGELEQAGGRLAEAGPSGEEELMELVRRLSPNQRRAFVLRELLGYSVSESAKLLGVSDIAVRVHASRARARLREQLREVERT
jgi:RNA polymerase sigma-70 factor (ECF subfamily)